MVPRSLTIQHTLFRKQIPQRHVDRFKKNETDFESRFIIMVEPRMHHYPEFIQRTDAGCLILKQTKREKFSKKI